MSDNAPVSAFDLDLERLGGQAFLLPAISAGLRHATLRGSLDYMHLAPGSPNALEHAFLCDLLTHRTGYICDRWFGGTLAAARIAGEGMGTILSRVLPAGRR